MRLLFNTHTSYAEDFASGRVRITESRFNHESELTYKQLKDLNLPSVIITAITRDGSNYPKRFFYIYPRDTLYVMGERSNVDAFAAAAGSTITVTG